MPILRGKIVPPVNRRALIDNWNGRFERPISCKAEITTDGSSLEVKYETWGVPALKTALLIEVGRTKPDSVIEWQG